MDQDHLATAIATDLSLDVKRVGAALHLLDEGNTIPFVARYRKELTHSLDEEQLRQIAERAGYRRKMEERREVILRSLQDQGILQAELEADVRAAETLQRLEDVYRPYKPKRRTRATMAREKGLQGLAELILQQPLTGSRAVMAEAYVDGQLVSSAEEAYAGARDIVAEIIADDPDLRGELRALIQTRGTLRSALADQVKDPKQVYTLYYDFAEGVRGIRPHQILALNRAERQGVISVSVELGEGRALELIAVAYPANAASPLAGDLVEARQDSYLRLLLPAVQRDARSELTEAADAHAIAVFAKNLRALLLQPPLRGHRVVGLDPGYRTGCKIAVVDATGKLMDTHVIYLDREEEARAALQRLVRQHQATLIAIGNGTAGRETEALVASLIANGLPAHYTIVSEAGASVYSASPLARSELPELDVSLRGAVSIARRIQDPLAELVKIDPQAIGVGLYQHDVNQKALEEALAAVVESVVNSVGADVNTASPNLLQHISGIGPKLAKAIVAYREAQGAFRSRRDLRNVPGLGPRAFEQAAGFLRITDGDVALDSTVIHPESYPTAQAVMDLLGTGLTPEGLGKEIRGLRDAFDLSELAETLNTGRATLNDVLEALARPGHDPRDDRSGPILRSDVLSLEDLKPGMQLQGTVRNVVDFGAFVDIGVKRDGLVHISSMGNSFVKSPHERVAVGDIILVEVLTVDVTRERISLAMVS